MTKTILFAALAATGLFSACRKEAKAPEQPMGICGTISYAPQQVLITVQHQNGTPAVLDSFIVTDINGNELPAGAGGRKVYGSYRTNGIMPGGCMMIDSNGIDGRYCLINELWGQWHEGQREAVRAIGYLGGSNVFNEPYEVIAANGKVSRNSGKEIIVLP